MNQHLRTGKSRRHHRMIGDVVDVSVRQPKSDDVPAVLLAHFQQWGGRVVGRIENDRLFRRFIRNQVGIGGEKSAIVAENFHGVPVSRRSSSSTRMLPIESAAETEGDLPSIAAVAKSVASSA